MEKDEIELMLVTFVENATYIKHSMYDDESDEIEINNNQLNHFTDKFFKIINKN